ncbi:hypothetical protein [Streptomyces herbicida]|uniref:hypothetical protein n=1 Tax=Streptomyces herbicida TaxID=3065675 RepID=UPI00292D93D9|nr:hypothetical protein [Streptomyces sp. NEAU-HV9]
MGTDIHGLIECHAWAPGLDAGETSWHAAIDLTMLGMVTRDYEAFACLFGVRNFSGLWRPVAADRGLPRRVGHDPYRTGFLGHCGIRHDMADLEGGSGRRLERAGDPGANRTARYDRASDGTLHLTDPSVRSRAFARASGINTLTTDPSSIPDLCPEGTVWNTGTTLFRAERDYRRDAVPEDGDWRPVWTVMRTLAAVHGTENVRLVVWFDE